MYTAVRKPIKRLKMKLIFMGIQNKAWHGAPTEEISRTANAGVQSEAKSGTVLTLTTTRVRRAERGACSSRKWVSYYRPCP